MRNSWKDFISSFLGHPTLLFIFTLVMAIICSLVPQSATQFGLVSVLGVFWAIMAIAYAYIRWTRQLHENLPGRIKYHKVIKEIRILNADGDAAFEVTYEGENLSDDQLEDLFHTMRNYDSTDYLPDKVEGSIDGQKTEVIVESTSKTRKNESGPPKYESKFIFKFPSPGRQRSPLPIHSFSVRIPKCFKKAFESRDKTVHSVDVFTEHLTIRLLTEDPVTITDWGHSVEDFHEHIDAAEIDRINKRSCPRLRGRKMLEWVIDKPILTNRYVLDFKLEKAR